MTSKFAMNGNPSPRRKVATKAALVDTPRENNLGATAARRKGRAWANIPRRSSAASAAGGAGTRDLSSHCRRLDSASLTHKIRVEFERRRQHAFRKEFLRRLASVSSSAAGAEIVARPCPSKADHTALRLQLHLLVYNLSKMSRSAAKPR
jgi:hypothetical protein